MSMDSGPHCSTSYQSTTAPAHIFCKGPVLITGSCCLNLWCACPQVVAFEFGREVMERLRQSNVASILEVMLTDIGASLTLTTSILPIQRCNFE